MKKVLVFLLTIIFIIMPAGCSKKKAVSTSNDVKLYTFHDDLGRVINVNVDNPKDIKAAACLGSLADIWSLSGGKVIGVTEDAFNEDRQKAESYGENLGSNKSPNVEEIIALKPDIVFLSSNLEGHKSLMEVLEDAGVKTVYLSVESFDDYLDFLNICTDITDSKENYQKYGIDVRQKVAHIKEDAKDKEKKNVLLLRATSSDIKAKNSNNMAGEMIKDLGCSNIADCDDTMLENISMESIIEKDPDYILVVPMGDSDEAEKTIAEQLTENPAWSNLTAVKNNRFVVLQKEYFHYKPNEKWGDSYEQLSEILFGKH